MICFLYLHMNCNNVSYPLVGCKYEILLDVSTESHIKQNKKKSREQLGRLCSSPEQRRGICKVLHAVMNAELLWSCQSSASPTSGAASALGCKKKSKKLGVNIVTQYRICISHKCGWIQGPCSSGRPIPRCLIIIFLNSL